MACGGDAGSICLQWYWWFLIIAAIAFVVFNLKLSDPVSWLLRILALIFLCGLVAYASVMVVIALRASR